MLYKESYKLKGLLKIVFFSVFARIKNSSDKVKKRAFSSSDLQLTSYNLQPRSFGFSLIELLIVMSIMGLLASIVLPESFNMLEQHQAQLEQKKLVDFFKDQKYQAYLLETQVDIELGGSSLQSSLGQELVFEFISAEYQVIEINELGRFEQDYIVYLLRDTQVEKQLGDL